MGLNEFKNHIEVSAASLLEQAPKRVVLLHHNDADGLTAAAILLKAFERSHLPLLRYCLEKPYPTVLEAIFANPFLEEGTVFVFADFGSGMLSEISQQNADRFPVFVLDHHSIETARSGSITLVNPLTFAVDGSTECSTSVLSFLFARALADYNDDLISLGLLGAAGDRHFTNLSDAKGVNRELFEAAVGEGIVDDAGGFFKNHENSLTDVARAVDALGSFGYFSGGPDIAIKGLIEGFDSRYHIYANQYQVQFDDALASFLESEPIKHEGSLSYFTLPESFIAFGVKTVGIVAEHIADTFPECAKGYVLGFQKVPDQIPGIGDVTIDRVKASVRVGARQRPKALDGSGQSVAEILKELDDSNQNIFLDACHRHAGAFTLPSECTEKVAQLIAAGL